MAIVVLPNTSTGNLNKAKASNKEGIIFSDKNDVEYLIKEVAKFPRLNQNM